MPFSPLVSHSYNHSDPRLAQGFARPVLEFESEYDRILWNSEYNRQVQRGASVTEGIAAADELYAAWKARSAKLKS